MPFRSAGEAKRSIDGWPIASLNVTEPSAAPSEKPRNMKEALSESTIGATLIPAMPISRVC